MDARSTETTLRNHHDVAKGTGATARQTEATAGCSLPSTARPERDEEQQQDPPPVLTGAGPPNGLPCACQFYTETRYKADRRHHSTARSRKRESPGVPFGQRAPSGAGASQWYANGVVIKSALVGLNHETLRYTKNGKPCFGEDYLGIGGTATKRSTSAIATYTDPTGATVATEHDQFTSTGSTSTVSCGGVTYTLDPMRLASSRQACSSTDAGATCATGACN